MTIDKNYNFDTESEYNFDNTKVEIVASEAKLKLIDNSGQTYDQDFASATGFTFNAAKLEFAAGKAQQIDQLPGIKMAVPFTTDADGSAGEGDLSATFFNSAGVTGGKLDLTPGALNLSKYATWDGVGKVRALRGAIKFKYTPNYTAPANDITFFQMGSLGVFDNQLILVHQTSKAIRVTSNTETGTVLQTLVPYGSWSPVMGQEYEFEYNWNFTVGSGRHQLFIDGVQQGSTQVNTGARSDDLTSSNYLGIGHPFWSNQLTDDLIIYDEPQHTANYTPGYSIPAFRYQTDYLLAPLAAFIGTPDGTLQSVQSFPIVSSSGEKYTFNNAAGDAYYWDGAAWVVSDKSIAQSSTANDIFSNLPTFPFGSATLDLRYGVSFPDSNFIQSYIDNLQINYTHQLYPITDPIISPTNATRIFADELTIFIGTETTPTNTSIKYIMVDNGTRKWFDTAAWVVSNGSAAQSNTFAQVDAAIGSLIPADTRRQIGFDALLITSDGVSTPLLDNVLITYDPALPNPTVRYVDLSGFIANANAFVGGIEIKARPYNGWFTNVLNEVSNIGSFVVIATTTSEGYFTGQIILQPADKPEGTKFYWELEISGQRFITQLPDQDLVDIADLILKPVY